MSNTFIDGVDACIEAVKAYDPGGAPYGIHHRESIEAILNGLKEKTPTATPAETPPVATEETAAQERLDRLDQFLKNEVPHNGEDKGDPVSSAIGLITVMMGRVNGLEQDAVSMAKNVQLEREARIKVETSVPPVVSPDAVETTDETEDETENPTGAGASSQDTPGGATDTSTDGTPTEKSSETTSETDATDEDTSTEDTPEGAGEPKAEATA